jgi:hypothetical protein
MEDAMELHENRTELERLLADVWNYEDGARRKTSLPKWLFAVTLTGGVLCTSSPSDVLAPITATFEPAAEKTPVDRISSENLDEDLDYRVARQTKSLAGWRAFLEAHPDGPHSQAAQAEIERLLPTPTPQSVEVAEQSPPSSAATRTLTEAAQSPAPPEPSPVVVENEPAPPPESVEVAERSPPSPAATQTPVEAAPAPPAPAVAENEPTPPPQPVEAAERPPPSPAATQTPVEAAQSRAAAVVAENEPAPPPIPAVAPDTIASSAPLPPLRPREVAVAKSEEPTHHRHWRAEHRQAGQPNVFAILVAQLFHRHR